MQHPLESITHYPNGWPGFEIVLEGAASVRSWLLGSSAIMGTLAWCAR